jgi:plasmid stabilization system protein ParE
MKRLSFRTVARRDLAEIREWYLKEAPHIIDKFADRIDESLDAIARSPTSFATIHGDVRACLVKRFPYVIYFRDLKDRVQVLAVLHARRDPHAWQSRL